MVSLAPRFAFREDVLLPELILRTAIASPDRVVCLSLDDLGPDHKPTLTSVTWRQLLTDILDAADFFMESFSNGPRKAGEPEMMVAIVARTNYQYYVTMLALVMLRWTAFVISPRNSSAAVSSLIQAAGVTRMVVDAEYASLGAASADPSTTIVHLSGLDARKTSKTAKDGLSHWQEFSDLGKLDEITTKEEVLHTAVCLHSSGSTGHPKIVRWSHRIILDTMAMFVSADVITPKSTMYSTLPLSHSMGVAYSLSTPLAFEGVYTFINTRQPPSASVLLRHCSLLELPSVEILCPGSILEDVVSGDSRETGVHLLRQVRTVTYGGCGLRQTTGDLLSKEGVVLGLMYGSTETRALAFTKTTKSSEPGDWQYIELLPGFNYHLKPFGEGEMKELVVVPDVFSPATFNHKEPHGCATGDVLSPHPSKEGLWKHEGRADDVTVLSNGEKTDNNKLTELLRQSPLIENALIFGAGQFMNGVIVAPVDPINPYTPQTVSAYIDTVWPYITEKVNPSIPQHSRLVRPLVLVVDPARPLLITDKNTVKTRLSIALYQNEIDAAYRRFEEVGFDEAVAPGEDLADDTSRYIRTAVSNIIGRKVDDSEDLFSAGLDSLLAMRVRAAVTHALRRAGNNTDVPRNVVFNNPTVSELMDYARGQVSSRPSSSQSNFDVEQQIEDIIEEHLADLPVHNPVPGVERLVGDVYVVTGTTGSLGSVFVSRLLEKPEVSKVYMLNRRHKGESLRKRQIRAFEDKGLDIDALELALETDRAQLLQVDLTRKDLGLNHRTYDQLRTQATHIVHIAWLLNFNRILSSFTPHIASTRHLISLALASPFQRSPHLTFISSIAAVGAWPFRAPVPEAALIRPTACLPQGYAHSKFAAERVVEEAVVRGTGLSAAVVRVGQLGGVEATGAWARTEHVPALIRSCAQVGVVPKDLPDARWLPVNVAADVLCSLVAEASNPESRRYSAPTFYHLENALSTPWSLVSSAIASSLSASGKPARLVSTSEWLRGVRVRPEDPVAPLLEFFESYARRPMPVLDMSQTRGVVGTRVECGVSEELVRRYVEYACRG
ncbi:acetyl-CoA synthetase-like protein [Dentipellis sp. KUC8613]|nr:acetyl-CoA synthetase-like protein [Dentipellis sp. KUC8613]